MLPRAATPTFPRCFFSHAKEVCHPSSHSTLSIATFPTDTVGIMTHHDLNMERHAQDSR